MIYIASVFALAGLALAWASNRRLAALEARLSRYNSALYDLSAKLDEVQQRVAQDSADIRFEMRRRAGEIAFTPQMTIGEIMSQHPAASSILANFHLGGCHSCAVSPGEVLGEVCQARGLDQQALLGALNRLGSGGSTEPLEMPTEIKRPNVQLIM